MDRIRFSLLTSIASIQSGTLLSALNLNRLSLQEPLSCHEFSAQLFKLVSDEQGTVIYRLGH